MANGAGRSTNRAVRMATIAAGILAFLISVVGVVVQARAAGGPALYEMIASGTTTAKVPISWLTGEDIGSHRPERLKIENPEGQIRITFYAYRGGADWRKAYPYRTTGTTDADTTITVAAGAGWSWPKRIAADVVIVYRDAATPVIITGGDE